MTATAPIAPGRAERRLKVTGTLHTASPVHVGGLAARPGVDLDLAVDGAGNPTVPGDSLAGALRGWHALTFGDEAAARLWGPLARRGAQPAASPVMIDDVSLPPDVLTELRDGIGIDRAAGTAVPGIKFVRAVLAVGTPLTVELTIDVAEGQQQDLLAELATLQGALQGQRVRIGAAKTRGLGRVGLDGDFEVDDNLLTSRAGMVAYLRHRHSRISLPEPAPASVATPAVEAELRWRPAGALMVRAAVTGLAADSLPLVGTGTDRRLHLLLPGSSIKGALRSCAEQIVRTVRDAPAPAGPRPDARFRRVLSQHDLIAELFGTAAHRDGPAAEIVASKQGAVFVEECIADRSLDPDEWRELHHASPSRARQALADLGLTLDRPEAPGPAGEHAELADHVAIDRFTGGAAAQRLFTVLEPHGFAWSPMRLRLELRRIRDEVQEAALGLLAVVLDSVAAGQVPFGFATTRGFGDVVVEQTHLLGEDLEDSALTPGAWRSSDLDEFMDHFRASLRGAWQTWIDNPPGNNS